MRAAFRQEGEATRFDTDRMVDQLARAGPAFSPVYSSFGEQDRVLAAVEGALETHGRGQEEVRQQVEGLRTLFDSLDTQGLGMVAVDDLMKLFGTSSKCRSFALGCAPQNVVTNFHNQGKRVPLGVTGA